MSLVIGSPSSEPITRAEAKAYLRLDTTDDDLSLVQTIAPGDHAAGTVTGSSVDVSGYDVTVYLNAGTCGSGGTVDVKLQDSSDGLEWTDVSGGTFSQVDESNDDTTYELAYTGGAAYLRAVATVANATCDFAVSIARQALTTDENDLLDSLIISARQWAEEFTRRAFTTRTCTLRLDRFPAEIILPRPPLSSVTSITYVDVNGDSQTLDSSAYQVVTYEEPARIVTAYGESWPSTRSVPEAVTVTYVAGYGDASAVPDTIKNALKLLVSHWFERREVVAAANLKPVPLNVERMLWPYRLLDKRLEHEPV